MRLKPPERIYFREQVRHELLAQGLLPLMLMTVVTLVLSLVFWQSRLVLQDRQQMSELSQAIDSSINAYRAEMRTFPIPQTEASLQQLRRQITTLLSQHPLKAKIYVVAPTGKVIVGRDDAPFFLEYGLAWGITAELDKKPSEEIMRVRRYRKSERNYAELQIGLKRGDYYVVAVIEDFFFANLAKEYQNSFIIADRYYRILYQSRPWSWASLGRVPDILQQQLQGKTVVVNKSSYLYAREKTLQDGLVRIIGITDLSKVIGTASLFAILLLFVFTASIIYTIFRSRKLAWAITSNLDYIVEAFKRLERGDLETKLDVYSNEEFAIITRSYNEMTQSLKQLMQSNEKKQEDKRLAQIKQLESQFNPHFLYNTLENIRYLIKLDPEKAASTIVDLCDLLREALKDEFTLLRLTDNLSYLEKYVRILHLRFQDRLQFKLEVEEGLDDCLMPKLILQPIIENSIKYGFQSKEQLAVSVKISSQEGNMLCHITDDGGGMPDELYAAILANFAKEQNQSEHTGLYNVHRRLQLIYGAAYGLKLNPNTGQGLAVSLVFPLRRGDA